MAVDDEAVEEALSACSSGSSKLKSLELTAIPADFYLDPRLKKCTVFDISHNALTTVSKVQ